ncbi:pentapeptide repeat-containing protein [Aquibium oceanicum]|uniref:Pentapeptide repeat-containing protein n=1 Tax=Aquibium oceanicum TaxID=1670800 RepID=A0A1L3SRN6_9HYPH|nr:pentapeptide repeat-containing protein [Aquibium oceanicum]APH72087.1 hypothetical protein BSQ44_12480 [Aquibium oceanicum]
MRIEARTESLEVAGADLSGSVFDDVAMARTKVSNADLSMLLVSNVNARGAVFEDVDLSGAVFRNTRLADVEVTESCIAGMRINGVLVTELLKAYEAAQSAGGE